MPENTFLYMIFASYVIVIAFLVLLLYLQYSIKKNLAQQNSPAPVGPQPATPDLEETVQKLREEMREMEKGYEDRLTALEAEVSIAYELIEQKESASFLDALKTQYLNNTCVITADVGPNYEFPSDHPLTFETHPEGNLTLIYNSTDSTFAVLISPTRHYNQDAIKDLYNIFNFEGSSGYACECQEAVLCQKDGGYFVKEKGFVRLANRLKLV